MAAPYDFPDIIQAWLDRVILPDPGEEAGPQVHTLGTWLKAALDSLDILEPAATGLPAAVYAEGAAANAGVSRKHLFALRAFLQGSNPTTISLTDVEAAATLLSSATETFELANGDTLIVATDGEADETVTFVATAGDSTSDSSPATDLSPTPANYVSGSTDTTNVAPVAGTSASATEPTLQDATPTAGTSTSGASPATDLATTTGKSVSGASPATDLHTYAGTSTSGAEPATDLSSTAGTSTSGAGPLTDMTTNEDTKFNVNVDGAGAQLATADWTGCDTGEEVAAALQVAARAASTTLVTCEYAGGLYVFTSPTLGASSSVVITPAGGGDAGYDCCDDLLLGEGDGGTEEVGTEQDTKFKIDVDGNETPTEITCDFSVASSGALIAAEMETQIQLEGGDYASVTVDYSGGVYVITSGTDGNDSAVVITNGDTSNVADSLKIGVANGGSEAGGFEADTKFKIDVDGNESPVEITCDFSAASSGALIAAELEAKIQLEGGDYAAVTVDYDVTTAGKYTIISGTSGTGSAVVITDGDTSNIADSLKLGVANGGSETEGSTADTNFKIDVDGNGSPAAITCDFSAANSGALIAAEMEAKIQAEAGDYAAVTVAYAGGLYVITSGATGQDSAVVITDGDSSNIADSLKIGVANGGSEAVGNWNTKLKVNIDDAGATELTCDWATGGGAGVCNTAAKIAAELQRVIRAVGTGGYAAATVTWNAGAIPRYVITSGTTGASSAVVVTDGDTYNVAASLELGDGNGGTEAAGSESPKQLKITLDDNEAVDIEFDWDDTCTSGAAIAAFMEATIQNEGGDFASVTVEYATNYYSIYSAQKDSTSLVQCADADANSCADLFNLGDGYGGVATARVTENATLVIAVDGNQAHSVDMVDWLTATDGTNTAAWMEAKIQAEGDEFAAVTVAYAGGLYVITSGMEGTDSAVVITDAESGNCADSLKLGESNNGVETPGTGDAANIAAATAQEVVDAITAAQVTYTAEVESTRVRLTSPTTGSGSSLVVNADSTADSKLGITGTDYGQDGLPVEGAFDDANYTVQLTLEADDPTDLGLSVHNRATDSFDIYCEDQTSVLPVHILIFGDFTPAES